MYSDTDMDTKINWQGQRLIHVFQLWNFDAQQWR